MSEPHITNDTLLALQPGMTLRSPVPVKRDMYDYAQILAIARNDSGSEFLCVIVSVKQGTVSSDAANFRLRYNKYLIHDPYNRFGEGLDGLPVGRLVPMSKAQQAEVQDLADAVS